MGPPMQARVKSVLSGDTIVLQNENNPRQERILSLAFVTAPRLKREGDEPFAFESRDFLRRLLVGKVVRFRILYTIPTGAKREYGIVFLPNNEEGLPEQALKDGWVKLRDDAGRKEDADEGKAMLEKFAALEARAKADSKGLWRESGPEHRIAVAHELGDTAKFLEEWKGKTTDAIVEKVLSGDRLIARLLLSPARHVQTIVLIAGIRSPATKRTNPSNGQEQPGEPFGDESQLFAETRLLQRSVNIEIVGASPQGQLIGVVKHPVNGAIAPYLLQAGMARCSDHHSTMLGSAMSDLRQSEQQAKAKKVGVFRDHVANRNTGGESDVVISKVQSADTYFIRNKAGKERRVNLSSVRQPKPSDPKQSPWGAEAKEFARRRLIGKHVKVTIDGKRPANEGYEEREMVSIVANDKNVALGLVENGYASVIRHRADDPDRSSAYDDLLQAEKQAQEQGKGMWGSKSPSTKAPVDYSANVENAKRQLTLLSRQRKVPAVVDFVKNGSRFTVIVPRDNAKLTLVLSGIRAPRSARNDNDTAEPFGQEAHDFANRRCNQRDVEIDVDDCDKNGGFIGTLFVNRENFAKLLLEEGFASVHNYSAEKSGHANELFAAEKKAKEGRKGLWHNWDPSQDEDDEDSFKPTNAATQNGDSHAATAKLDYRDIVITHVEPNGKLKFQQIGNGTAALTELMSKFRSFHLNSSNSKGLDGPPKAGEILAAKFSADGEWYRARVRRNDREKKKAEVVYIDYGNSENVDWSSLRPLTQPEFATTKLRAQAQDAQLSFLKFPESSPEYMEEAVNFLLDTTGDRQLVASVDATDSKDGTLSITLYDPKQGEEKENSVNAECVSAGFAMVARKLKPFEKAKGKVIKSLQSREEEAKGERRGMWEFGDPTGDDE